MPKTRTDYLRAVLRRFSNGSVIAEFSVFLTQTSNLNPKDFEDQMNSYFGSTNGAMGGVNIVIDPEHITFTCKLSASLKYTRKLVKINISMKRISHFETWRTQYYDTRFG